MSYYLEGKTIPGGAYFFVADPHLTIDAALIAAKEKMAFGSASVLIVDQDKKVVLTAEEVTRRLKDGNSN